MLPVPAAHAIPITFELNLSGANEVAPVSPAGTGFATVVLDPTAQTIQVSATFSGLTSNTTAAHIHCCAPLGTNAMVATLLPAFTDFPSGVTSGIYPPHVFDLTMASSYNPAFITAHGGTVAQAELDFIAGVSGGQSYLNIHTVNNMGGEIRAQLLSPARSSVRDCPAFYWQVVAFSPGGDVVSGLLEEKLWRWSSSQLGWVVDSRSDIPFARLCPIDIVKPQ